MAEIVHNQKCECADNCSILYGDVKRVIRVAAEALKDARGFGRRQNPTVVEFGLGIKRQHSGQIGAPSQGGCEALRQS